MNQNVETFFSYLRGWLRKNNLWNVKHFALDRGFGYCELLNHTLYIGVEEEKPEIQQWFIEFLEENGLLWEEIPVPILAFLHEVGHSETLPYFNKEDNFAFYVNKMAFKGKWDRQTAFDYWSVPDEFAANTWLIEFVNNHIDAVIELINLYADNWNNLSEEDLIIE